MAQVPPLGMRCAWCRTSDWQQGELAIAPGLDAPVPNNFQEIFHDRSGVGAEGFFDPVFFDPAFFDTGGETAGACYTQARAAGVVG